MCTRFNIDVIKSQLDLIQPASLDQDFFLFSLSRSFFSPVRRRIYFFSFPLRHILSFLVGRHSIQHTHSHQNKRVNRPIVAFFFVSFLTRTTKHHSFVIRTREEQGKEYFLCISFHTSYQTERDDWTSISTNSSRTVYRTCFWTSWSKSNNILEFHLQLILVNSILIGWLWYHRK